MRLLIRNTSIVDVKSGKVSENVNLLVNDGRIERITVVDASPEPEAEKVIDGTGKFAIPGMIDTHIHLKARRYSAPSKETPISRIMDEATDMKRIVSKLHTYIYSGVTSVFDAGNLESIVHPLREAERKGEIESPRIFCTGNLVTAPGGHGYEVGCEIESMEKDGAKLNRYLDSKPDMVKITYDEHGWGIRPLIPVLAEQTLKDIILACHDRGLRVTVHVSNELRSREAMKAGADVLAHTVIQSPVTEDFVKIVAESGTPVVSTLQIGDGYSRLVRDPGYLSEGLYRDCLDNDEREFLVGEERERLAGNIWTKWMEIMTPVVQDNIRRIQGGGGIVSAGTDGTSGPDFHRELMLLSDAGLSNKEVLSAATINGARVLGRAEEIGSLEEGKIADIVLLNGNPVEELKSIQDISMVIKSGEVIDRSSLDLPVNR